MVHLPIHLAWEAKVAGPVQYKWMYPIERYLHKLKGCVRNKAHPEGSIAEGYLADECLTFCSRYLNQVETKFNKPERNYDGGQSSHKVPHLSIFSTIGRPLGKRVTREMNIDLYNTATFYILENCEECEPYVKDHKKALVNAGVRNVEEIHRPAFVNWFEEKITRHYDDGLSTLHMVSLAHGPKMRVIYHSVYNINGFRFRTTQCDKTKRTQNSGVMVKGEHLNDGVPYYGRLKEIVELVYTEEGRVVLFNCDWFDTVRERVGYKRDRYGLISINTTQRLNTEEPFVLASQSIQVYFVKAIKDQRWSSIFETKPRNLFEMPLNANLEDEEEDEI